MTKEEILSLYLNNIYLGNGAYGIEAAAESYFNKRVEQLNLAEMAMIAGLVKAPSRYSPSTISIAPRADRSMSSAGWPNWVSSLRNRGNGPSRTSIKLQSRESAYFSKAPYFTEFIRHQVEKKYGKEKLYQEGLRIYTTLDLSLQRAAQRAVEGGLRELDKRQGFRGPIRTLSPGEVKNLLEEEREPLASCSE